MAKKVIRSPKVAATTLPLSQAVLAGNTLYIHGAVACNDRGEIVGKGDIRAQTKQALENIKALVEEALSQAEGNITEAARKLGRHRKYVERFLKKLTHPDSEDPEE